MRSATSAESIAWSKWLCTGNTAASRCTPTRARQPSTRAFDGAIRPSPIRARLGREKKPSVMIAVVPSSISSVETPSHVNDTAVSAVAAGTANRSA